ncbi:hypothetical protein [Amycolatopsis sp.]|jgi:hypothetical protein|uniref:hypothetical protein n=1 Tax=Amycolatopsis sp. TaxID=37632 RepID=UPI002DFD7364|nr:hypothetical protein [Amycolatopsis sp.]
MTFFLDSAGLRWGAVLFASIAVLSACGGQPAGQPQVASLPSASAPAPTSSTVDESQRPQLRLDDTDEEIKQAWAGYNSCLKEHGHKVIAARGDSPDQNDNSPAGKAATVACKGKLPLQPPEMDAGKNPRFLDDYRDWITCLNQKGVPVKATDPPGSGWTYTAQPKMSATASRKIELDCKMEAFSGK